MDRQTVYDYIKKKYKAVPEYPWRKYPGHAVFRHKDNNKWFALQAGISGDKVGVPEKEYVDVINLKVDDMFFRDLLVQEDGIMPAYHMNKMHWISVLLDGTVPEEKVFDLIDMSFMATASAKKKEKIRPPKEWIIPANPKYFDIVHAFDDKDLINWKQGAGIKKGDTVFMYVAAPVSAVLYKCKVIVERKAAHKARLLRSYIMKNGVSNDAKTRFTIQNTYMEGENTVKVSITAYKGEKELLFKRSCEYSPENPPADTFITPDNSERLKEKTSGYSELHMVDHENVPAAPPCERIHALQPPNLVAAARLEKADYLF